MNTNDLPPAAKLAALIEAGRAANPDLKHGIGCPLENDRACALGFAALAAGAARERLEWSSGETGDEYRRVMDPCFWLCEPFTEAVWGLNDNGASLDEIILSLREGELATVPA